MELYHKSFVYANKEIVGNNFQSPISLKMGKQTLIRAWDEYSEGDFNTMRLRSRLALSGSSAQVWPSNVSFSILAVC